MQQELRETIFVIFLKLVMGNEENKLNVDR